MFSSNNIDLRCVFSQPTDLTQAEEEAKAAKAAEAAEAGDSSQGSADSEAEEPPSEKESDSDASSVDEEEAELAYDGPDEAEARQTPFKNMVTQDGFDEVR